jgi:hypothetical protein
MQQKLLINLLLLTLVALLALLVWLEPGKAPDQPLKPLGNGQPEHIDRLRIEHPDGPTLEFQREAGQWRMLAPYEMPANGMKLDALTRVVDAPVLSDFALPPDGLAQFGLDRPLRLQLDDLSFLFGGNDPINQHRYVAHANRLALTVDRFYHHLSASAEQLVSPALLPADAVIQDIHTPDYRLTRDDTGWQLDPPDPALSADELSRHASQWRQAQGLAVRHFDPPGGTQTVEIHLDNAQRLRFVLRQQDGKTWLVRTDNGLGYQLPANSTLLSTPQPAPQPATPATDA